MKKSDFDKLKASVKEAGRIRRGEAKPSREFTVTRNAKVKRCR